LIFKNLRLVLVSISVMFHHDIPHHHHHLATILILQHSILLSRKMFFDSLQASIELYQQSGILNAVSKVLQEAYVAFVSNLMAHAHDVAFECLAEQVLKIVIDHSLCMSTPAFACKIY